MYARDTARIATPVGIVEICGDEYGIASIAIGVPREPADAEPVRAAAEQLEQWFASVRTAFDLPLLPAATPRGQTLREAMVAIGYGDTLSYGELARVAGSSPRAIGQACSRNPFPIVVPCHRILNADGSLGAYSAGAGPATKRWLLDFERRERLDLLL